MEGALSRRVDLARPDGDVEDLLNAELTQPDAGSGLRARFESEQHVHLPGFLSARGLERLRREAAFLDQHAIRKDFRMACMGGSPRHMRVLGADDIQGLSGLVPALYESPRLRRFLGEVCGAPVCTPADGVDRFVLNSLVGVGDTHGAHLDDYPLALVIGLEAPPASSGGVVEFVPGAERLEAFGAGPVRRLALQAGDAYLLKADTSPHRVTALRVAGETRRVLNFMYGIAGQAPIWSTPSASELYARG